MLDSMLTQFICVSSDVLIGVQMTIAIVLLLSYSVNQMDLYTVIHKPNGIYMNVYYAAQSFIDELVILIKIDVAW